ncbi:DUF4276 family protein [Azospirillaceae bacterium]
MSSSNKKTLLVEGKTEKLVISALMEKSIIGFNKEYPPIQIETLDGKDDILKSIPTYIKSENSIGIVIDADGDFQGTWNQIYNKLEYTNQFPELPETLPLTGLVIKNEEGKRLGVWVMPNNTSQGMLETFLAFLIPKKQNELWKTACSAVTEAKKAGAQFRKNHEDKANIYTWLAWQDPPGEDFKIAICKKTLEPNAPLAKKFVKWLCDLFEIQS